MVRAKIVFVPASVGAWRDGGPVGAALDDASGYRIAPAATRTQATGTRSTTHLHRAAMGEQLLEGDGLPVPVFDLTPGCTSGSRSLTCPWLGNAELREAHYILRDVANEGCRVPEHRAGCRCSGPKHHKEGECRQRVVCKSARPQSPR